MEGSTIEVGLGGERSGRAREGGESGEERGGGRGGEDGRGGKVLGREGAGTEGVAKEGDAREGVAKGVGGGDPRGGEETENMARGMEEGGGGVMEGRGRMEDLEGEARIEVGALVTARVRWSSFVSRVR